MPATGFPKLSLSVTVLVESDTPSDRSEVGEAMRVDCELLTAPGKTVIRLEGILLVKIAPSIAAIRVVSAFLSVVETRTACPFEKVTPVV